jgi:class 3 adenylate cyclase/tetratricopeptide (TPR) repeat protein
MRACPNCGRENPDEFRVCPICATPLAEPGAPERQARKTVTMVFCDVAGSTAFGDGADPEVLRSLMARYFDGMRAVIERHGGTVEKFIGDAVMAVFGVPQVHEDDALRAVRAAAEMQAELAELSIPARIGVNTGEVVANERDSLVTGDAVNVAARLEQAAGVGQVLIGGDTYELVRSAVDAEPVQPLTVKGKAEPLAAWRLVSVHDVRAAVPRRMDIPLVGREGELRLLEEAFDRAGRERRCHLFTVLGEAGVGKSRLVAELVRERDEVGRVLTGQCLPYGEGITYWPLAEMVRTASDAGADDDRLAARRRLDELLAGDEQGAEVADRVACAIGLADDTASAQEIHWAVRRMFEVLARERPAVVVFEDIHWAEPPLLDLIDHVAEWSRSSPFLLVTTARPDLLDQRPSWAGGKTNATTIQLEPLAAEDCGRLISALRPDRELADGQQERVIAAAEGNPLFLEQMVAMLAGARGSKVIVPPSITALLAARLDQLPPDDRLVVEAASVEGREFHRSALLALLPDSQHAGLEDSLRRLVRRELIDPAESQFRADDAFRFQHQLIRDAAYQGISKRDRARHHEALADWIGRAAGERADEYAEIVAYHLAEAVRYGRELGQPGGPLEALSRRAAALYRQAADRAVGRGDLVGASALVVRFADLLPSGDPAVVLAFADCTGWLDPEDMDGALRAAARAQCAAAESGDPTLDDLARVLATVAASHTDQTVDHRRVFDDAWASAQRAEAAGRQREAARMWCAAAGVAATSLQLSAVSAQAARRTVELATAYGETWLAGVSAGIVAVNDLRCPGRIDDQIAATAEMREGSSVLRRAELLQWTGLLMAQQGRLDEALEMADRAAAIWQELGIDTWTAIGHPLFVGNILLAAGHPAEAIEWLRTGVDGALERGAIGIASTISGLLARCHALLGDNQAALAEAGRAAEMTGPGDVVSELVWRGARVRALAGLGEGEQALALAREMAEIAVNVDVAEYRFEIAMDVAEAERAAGNAGAARERLEWALADSETRGALAFAEQARAALADLDAG